jgi:hypothetical protein
MFEILFTFLFTSLFYFLLVCLVVWFGCRRISLHIKDKPYALNVLVEHVIAPLFRPARDPDEETRMDRIASEISLDEPLSVEEAPQKQ